LLQPDNPLNAAQTKADRSTESVVTEIRMDSSH